VYLQELINCFLRPAFIVPGFVGKLHYALKFERQQDFFQIRQFGF
jgi:hypothetical protein